MVFIIFNILFIQIINSNPVNISKEMNLVNYGMLYVK